MDIPEFPNNSVNEDLHINDIQLFIDEFEVYFDRQVIGEIKKAMDNKMGAAAYILASCAIDCLASFWRGKDSNGTVYKEFINAFFAEYNAKYLYEDLRCRLVHNYTLGANLIMCWDEADLHKTCTNDGKVVINLEQFFEDFKAAKTLYFAKARQDRGLQEKLTKRWREVGILSPIFPDTVRDQLVTEG